MKATYNSKCRSIVLWPAGIIEIVNVARTIWKVEDPWFTLWNILKQDVQNDVTSLNTKKCILTFQPIGYKRMMQPVGITENKYVYLWPDEDQ
jgi:hypothetical protein